MWAITYPEKPTCSRLRSNTAVEKSLASVSTGDPDVRIRVVAISRVMLNSRLPMTSARTGSSAPARVASVSSMSLLLDSQSVVTVFVQTACSPGRHIDGGIGVLDHRRPGDRDPRSQPLSPEHLDLRPLAPLAVHHGAPLVHGRLRSPAVG